MTYQQAICHCLLGQKIRRKGWPKYPVYVYHTKKRRVYTRFRTAVSGACWFPKPEDLIAIDWEIV